MSKNIQLQEEFEALIIELNRLKSINDLTSSNSDNARNIIGQIESLVTGINSFKEGINDDFNRNKKELEGVTKILTKSINGLKETTEVYAKRFDETILKSAEDNLLVFTENQKKLNNKIEAYSIKLDGINQGFLQNFKEIESSTLNKIDEQGVGIIGSIDKCNKAISASENLINSELSIFKKHLDENFNHLENEMLINRRTSKSTFYLIIGLTVFLGLLMIVAVYLLR